MTKCSTEGILSKGIEDWNWLENLDWCTCSFCQIYVGMTFEEAKCCKECKILG